jgi:hypothetical protein
MVRITFECSFFTNVMMGQRHLRRVVWLNEAADAICLWDLSELFSKVFGSKCQLEIAIIFYAVLNNKLSHHRIADRGDGLQVWRAAE